MPHKRPTQLLPALEITDGPYDLKVVQAPVLKGLLLRIFTLAFESPLGSLLYPIIAKQSNFPQVLNELRFPEPPLFRPDVFVSGTDEPGCSELSVTPGITALQAALDLDFSPFFGPSRSAWDSPVAGRATVADYTAAYQSGSTTPTEVAERLIEFIKRSEAHGSRCKWLLSWDADDIRRQASASTARWQARAPLSRLDGVPYAVKDFIDALPYPTTDGTTFRAGMRPVSADAPYIKVLRSAGAVLLGKTTLHEIGLGITGRNEGTGTARNPYDLEGGALCGGSSSGTAAVLAAGICPIAVGTDGGGSIRIPASFCGCVGLKPTSGRITAANTSEIDCTVATSGPMGGSVADVAVLYAAMANVGLEAVPGQPQPPTMRLPAPLPRSSAARPLSGLRLGLYCQWFDDCDPAVLSACRAAVAVLGTQGADIDEGLVLPELEHLRVAHNVTIVSEMYNNFKGEYSNRDIRRHFGGDARIALSVAKHWTPADYIQAQRIRARATVHWRRAFTQVDIVVTPTTPCTAPYVSHKLRGGLSNLVQTSTVMRYMLAGNLLGLPAISIPVGHDDKGLPIGLQLIGRPWEEATLLRAAAVLESALQRAGVTAGVPRVHINPLTGETAGL